MAFFHDRLYSLRVRHGFSQAQVIAQTGIKQSSYSNYEAGLYVPDINTICDLSDVFAVSIDYLCGYADTSLRVSNTKISNLPDRLKELRKLKHLTQEATGSRIGVTQTNYSAYERGRFIPPLDKVHALAKLHGVSMDYLCGYNESTDAPETPVEALESKIARLGQSQRDDVEKYVDYVLSKQV